MYATFILFSVSYAEVIEAAHVTLYKNATPGKNSGPVHPAPGSPPYASGGRLSGDEDERILQGIHVLQIYPPSTQSF